MKELFKAVQKKQELEEQLKELTHDIETVIFNNPDMIRRYCRIDHTRLKRDAFNYGYHPEPSETYPITKKVG